MKRLLAKMLTAVLLLNGVMFTFCATALAATKGELLGFKNYLSSHYEQEKLMEGVDLNLFAFYDDIYYIFDEEDGKYVGIVANGKTIDEQIKNIINRDADGQAQIGTLLILFNSIGKMIKEENEYGIHDLNLLFGYETLKDNVGAELSFGMVYEEGEIYIVTDDIFGFEGTNFSFTETYDKKTYDFDLNKAFGLAK